jgi:hypothetical protein
MVSAYATTVIVAPGWEEFHARFTSPTISEPEPAPELAVVHSVDDGPTVATHRMGFGPVGDDLLDAIACQGGLRPWHLRLAAEVYDRVPNSRSRREGGKVYRSATHLSGDVAHDAQSVRKALGHEGPLAPWMVLQCRTITVTPMSRGWRKVPHWWLDDMRDDPGSDVLAASTGDTLVKRIMTAQAVTDLGL